MALFGVSMVRPESEMSDGSADRQDALPTVRALLRSKNPAERRLGVSMRMAEEDEASDLSDRRVIKVVFVVAACLLFGLAVLGWV